MKTRFLFLALIAAGTAAAQQPVATQHGIVAIHNLRIEDTTYMGQVPGIWATDGADTMFGFLPMYMLPDTTLLIGSDTVYTSGNFTGGGGGGLDSVNLASDVYGVLPVLNGGTGHDTLTAGKVLVGNGTSPVLSPAALHWDNINSRLGIGTAAPNQQLELTGNLRLPTTTATAGIIYRGTQRFIHGFGGSGAAYFGAGAGNLTNTGIFNTGVGSFAMDALTSGSYNTIVGYDAGGAITTGGNNTGVGFDALGALTTGSVNVAIGRAALGNLSTGGSNIAIGNNAGRYLANGTSLNATGSSSVFLGNSTKANADGETNQVVIGGNATGLGSNTVVIGDTSIITTALRGNVGINTTTPVRRLHVAGEVRITDLVTDTATVIVGADADGDLGRIVVGTGLALVNDTLQASGGSSGTVTSVGLSAFTGLTVTGSPVTTSGTLALGNGLDANKVMVSNGATGYLAPTALHWDNTNTRLGINTSAPGARLVNSHGTDPASGLVNVPSYGAGDYRQTGTTSAQMGLIVANSNNTSSGRLIGFKSHGSFTAPTIPSSGSRTMMVGGAVYDGNNMETTAEIEFVTDGTTTLNNAPQRINFLTGTGDVNSKVNRLSILSGGNIGINQASPSYILDINSTGGVRVPAGTDAQRPVQAAGVVRFSTTANTLEWSDGTNWESGVSGLGQGPASGFNRAALWTGAQELTNDEDFSFNISTGQLKMLKYSSATAFTGTSVAQLHVTSAGNVITKPARDTQYVYLVAVNPGTAVTQTAGTAFHQGSFLVPEWLDGFVVSRADYALANCNSTSGTLTVGLRQQNTTNGTVASNLMAVSFSGTTTEVRKSSTSTITLSKNQWLRVEVNPTTSGTLNNTVEGLLVTLMLTK